MKVGLVRTTTIAATLMSLVAALAILTGTAWAADTSTTVAGPAPAAAPAPADTGGLTATQMKVSVWPEYDDPRVLVINQADLDSNTKLPTDVSFNIPKGAEIGMACELDASQNHNCKPYQLVDKGDYQTLTYKVEASKTVFMEYYYEASPAGQTQRDFTYTFRPGFSVGNLTMEVQEPLRATGFTLSPDLPSVQTDSQGLKYHTKDFASVTPAAPIDVKVSYSKPDFNTSVKPKDKNAPSGASGGGGSSASSSGSGNRTLFLVLGVLGIGTLFFAGYKVMRPAPVMGGRGAVRRGPRPTSTGTRGTRDRGNASAAALARGGGSGGSKGGTKFCTGCGANLRRQDQFCPDCGGEQA